MKNKYSIFSNYRFIMKEVNKFDKRIPMASGVEIILNILGSFTGILFPAVIVAVITREAPLDKMACVIGGCVLIFGLVAYFKAYLNNRNQWQLIEFRAGYLTRKLMKKATSMTYSEYMSRNMQEKFAIALSSVGSNATGVERVLADVVTLASSAGVLLIYLILFGVTAPVLVAIVLASAIIQLIFLIKANKKAYENLTPKSQQSIGMNYLLRKATDVAAAKDVRLYGMKEWLVSLYKKANSIFEGLIKQERKMFLSADIIGVIVEILCQAGCYVYLFFMMRKGLSITGFVMFAGIIQTLSAYIKGIPGTMSEMSRYLREFDSYRELAEEYKEEEKELSTSDEKKSCSIEFSHVSFSYPGMARKILDDVSFEIKSGDKIALVGENGAGKSTIISLICGFLKPTEGKIIIDGKDISQMSKEELAQKISTVFQDSSFWNFNLEENVSCMPSEITDQAKVEEAIERVSLLGKINTLEKKTKTYYGTTIDDSGISLSGGELQKMLIARSIYAQRPILLLDEPTAALDAITESEIYSDYNRLTKDKTVIYISHRLASTRFCDEIWFLKDGKIKERGSHDELLKKNGDYAEMFNVQSSYYTRKSAI